MDPKHLLQLAVILEKGSISAAAEHLLLTQPTLTRNMNTLEMQAGGNLFSRSRFGVRSTPLGESLAREGRAIARQLQSAQETISRHKLGFHNQLRVAVGPLIGMALMPRLCQRLLSEHPHIALTVTCGRPQQILEALLDGNTFDVVISPAIHQQVPHSIARTHLAEDQLGVFCGPDHPLAHSSQFDPAELNDCEWMNIATTSPFQNLELEMLEKNGIKRIKTQFATVSDAVILLDVLMQGRHLAVLPRLPVRLLGKTHPLCELPLPEEPVTRALWIWCRETMYDSEAFQVLCSIAKEIVDGQ